MILPQAVISELIFNGSNRWELEIDFNYSQPFYREQYDSICISTLNGFSRIRLQNIKDKTRIFVINADSLVTPLSIDKDGDRIRLYSFLSFHLDEPLIDSLLIGNYPGSSIDSLRSGYSVSRVAYSIFSKDKSPTIGLPNDTAGTCGTIEGILYDKNNSLVTKGNFILENPVGFKNNGMYSTRIYSRKVEYSFLLNNYKPSEYQWVRIDTLKLNINPDILYIKDVHFLDDYNVMVKDKIPEPNYHISVINYPNPFNSVTNFVVHIPPALQYKERQINIYNMNGQIIQPIHFSNHLQATWDGKDYNGNAVSSGIYYYQLIIDGKSYSTGSMILLR
jgi:hypothetical protein